jgi:hypothetical protein
LFRFEATQKNQRETKRNKNFWKQNKAKIRCINFALVGSEKFEAKEAIEAEIFSYERAKRMQNGSRFASFRFEAKNLFWLNWCSIVGRLFPVRGTYLYLAR